MRYFYDCEFLEDGKTIAPLSIGIVAEDGREFYAVFADAPWKRVRRDDWLMQNVVPHLPKAPADPGSTMLDGGKWLFNIFDPCVKSTTVIRAAVRDFLTCQGEKAELWGYYSAYDHVLLAQLFGRMVNLPPQIPMWTNDLQQSAFELGVTLPPQQGDAHHALADARWIRDTWMHLMTTQEG